MKLDLTCLLRASLAAALLFVPAACMSLEDYHLPPQLAGRLSADSYSAPDGGWSVTVPLPEYERGRRAAEVADAAPNPRQTTLIVGHPERGLEWSVDVLDASAPGEPALDTDFMLGFFEWLATCDDAATPGAREVRADETGTLDGAPARWIRAEPGTAAAAGERGCLAVLVKREPYWVACLVKYRLPASESEAALRGELTELVRSFRVTAR